MSEKVAAHYTHGNLMADILARLDEAGLDAEHLTVDDLAPLDHLHGRGRQATEEMIDKLAPTPGMHVIDIGCGVGGPARFLAAKRGCRVTGVDLTAEFIAVANELAARTGLTDVCTFRQADALALPFGDATFDAGYTQNVSMSVPDKAKFFREAFRVLKPGAKFFAGEVAQGPGGEVLYPVPWAMSAEISHLTAPEETRAILEGAGFKALEMTDSHDAAMAYNRASRERIQSEGMPVLTPLVILAERARERMQNSARNVEQKRVIPVEFLCLKP